MARFVSHGSDLVYQAAEAFRDQCLMAEGSLLFDDISLWTATNLAELHKAFNAAPDVSQRNFLEKFRDQIRPAGQGVIRLAAEVVAVHFLFPSNVGGARKRELIQEVLSWSEDVLPEDRLICQALNRGIGSGGYGFNARRPFELGYLIDVALSWKSKTAQGDLASIQDPWKFRDFLDSVEGGDSRQLRHMLLHLFFPDQFERIASRDHKWRIDVAFSGLVENPSDDMDERLLSIRKALEELLPEAQLDFYQTPLSETWYDTAEGSDQFAPLEVIHYKKQIVLYGPPGTGKTHRARSVGERIIHSAALDKWGAGKYFKNLETVRQSARSHIHVLQLHPAYSYEDFIRGLHLANGKTEYRLGFLPKLVVEHINTESKDTRLPHVLILDEMNRADLSRLLGECFSLLEYRDKVVTLPGTDSHGNQLTIEIPSDLYIIGTMNLIDQSIEQVDFALRRRFLWISCPYDAETLLTVVRGRWDADPAPYNPWDRVEADFKRLASAASALNAAISQSDLLGPQYEIGHTYFFDITSFLRQELQGAKAGRKYFLWRGGRPMVPVEKLWRLSLRPLLFEYLAGLRGQEREDELGRLEAVFFSSQDPVE